MDSEKEETRLKRWRLVLGEQAGAPLQAGLTQQEQGMDKTLAQLYDNPRKAGLDASAPRLTRWLGDIREYFPEPVARVMQQDAIERLPLQQVLQHPELADSLIPDVHLLTSILHLTKVIPDQTKSTARLVVKKIVDQLMEQLRLPTIQAVNGSLYRAARRKNAPLRDTDWHRTILKNLKHYQPDYQTIIPQTRISYGRRQQAMKEIVLCVDQSGSMGTSVVYSGIFAAVLASMPSLKTRLVVFDTSLVDLTDELQDPVELLFGVQLGGGTDIEKALSYCHKQITRPADTILVLISDLFEGGNARAMRDTVRAIVQSGTRMITLLALNDDGAPAFDHEHAAFLGTLGVPVFACTPHLFPDMMAVAIAGQDLGSWAAGEDIFLVTPPIST